MTLKFVGTSEATYKLEKQVGFLLRLAGQRHANIFHALNPIDLTPTQFSALVKLLHLGKCSQNELGRQTAMDVATIKGVIDRLRRRGFVDVSTDPNDKRRSLLTPTASAKELVDELHTAGTNISEATLKPLSKTERAKFLDLLSKIS